MPIVQVPCHLSETVEIIDGKVCLNIPLQTHIMMEPFKTTKVRFWLSNISETEVNFSNKKGHGIHPLFDKPPFQRFVHTPGFGDCSSATRINFIVSGELRFYEAALGMGKIGLEVPFHMDGYNVCAIFWLTDLPNIDTWLKKSFPSDDIDDYIASARFAITLKDAISIQKVEAMKLFPGLYLDTLRA